MRLLCIASRPANIKNRLHIWVDKPVNSEISLDNCQTNQSDILHLIPVGVNLEFTAVVVSLKGCQVSKTANSAARILPGCGSDTRDTVFRDDARLVYSHLGETTSILIPFERMSRDSGDVYITAKVTR